MFQLRLCAFDCAPKWRSCSCTLTQCVCALLLALSSSRFWARALALALSLTFHTGAFGAGLVRAHNASFPCDLVLRCAAELFW